LKVLNHLVLSSVNGEVNRNVLMPNRMNVSSQSGAEACLLERRYLTIKARLAQKFFWDLNPRQGLLADDKSLSAAQTTSGGGPPSERIVTVCIR
jgi:hypothetical protein